MTVTTPTTQADLDNLIRARNRGVLEVREGNTWVKYTDFKSIDRAIREMQIELGAKKPTGTRRVRVSRGY